MSPLPCTSHRTTGAGCADLVAAVISAPLLLSVERPVPDRLPAPSSSATVHIDGANPAEPSRTDFHFDAIEKGAGVTPRRFSLKELLESPTVSAKSGEYQNPDIRWIHLPFNSMKFTEDLMAQLCSDIGFTKPHDVASAKILAGDKWLDRLHQRGAEEGHHATFMETSCFEINFNAAPLSEKHAKYFDPKGTSMGFFMPFLHWGTEDTLLSHMTNGREPKTAEITGNGGPSVPLQNVSRHNSMHDFYKQMRSEQLFDDKHPLHLRRTLDQFYYNHIKNTANRDMDQVVAKHGPNKQNKGRRPVQMVDQLWLWVLGSNTVITCFDRRAEKKDRPQANVYEKIIWQLNQNGQSKCIKSGFELAHLIIEQASGYFFNYSHSLPPELRFKDIFHKVIGKISDDQVKLFKEMANLSRKKAPMDFTRDQQNKLFDIHDEFNLLLEIRDVIDELTIMDNVIDQQLFVLDPLSALHFQDSFERRHKRPEFTEEYAFGLLQYEFDKRNWDERDWFKRTKQYIKAHHKEIEEMMKETLRVYEALRDAIALKQSNASIFEAHASRKESEAVTLFTWVSSVMLPMSFISSIFGMNVTELESGGKIPLWKTLAFIIPVSVFISIVFVCITFLRPIREWAVRPVASEGFEQGKGRCRPPWNSHCLRYHSSLPKRHRDSTDGHSGDIA